MRRLAAVLLLLMPCAFVPACGGGGSSTPAPTCSKPGTLRALALEGQPAPGTAGSFGPFPIGLLLDTADNGWSVFTGPTTDVAASQGLWVAEPDGSVHLVFRAGETVPDAGGGTIFGFQLARVNGQGQVLAKVQIAGDTGGRTFGLLTAQVLSSVVTAKNDLVYGTQDMTASGATGTLTSVDETRTFFLADGRTFFAGLTTTTEALWSVSIDGTNLQKQVKVGDTVQGPSTILDLKQVGVSRSGARFAFAADTSSVTNNGLYDGITGTSTYQIITRGGDGLALASPVRGGSIVDANPSGPLLVYDSGAVVWKARGSALLPDDVILVGNSTAPYSVLLRSGDPVPGGGGATFGSITLLQHRAECVMPMVDAQIVGAASGLNDGLYGLGGTQPALALYQGRPAPSDYGTSSFTATFPGLNTQGFVDVARNGGLAFAGLLQNGVSGIFWLIPSCGFFSVAVSGGAAPGGGTFGAFSPSATHTTHDGVVLFRAALTAGSGVFRQGP